MPEYPFTGDYDRVFSDLLHGPGVTVLRAPEPGADRVPVEADPGQTVHLWPGDVLVTEEPVGPHAELAGSIPDPAPEPAPEPAETPAPPARAGRRTPTPSTTDTADTGDAGASA